jgi:hypothetical protein
MVLAEAPVVKVSWVRFKERANGELELADSCTLPAKPFKLVAVIVDVAEAEPDVRETNIGFALIPKSPCGGLGTMKVTFVE